MTPIKLMTDLLYSAQDSPTLTSDSAASTARHAAFEQSS